MFWLTLLLHFLFLFPIFKLPFGQNKMPLTKDFDRLLLDPSGPRFLCAFRAKWSTSYWNSSQGTISSYLQLLFGSWPFLLLLWLLVLWDCALVCKRFNFFQVFLSFLFIFRPARLFGPVAEAILSRYLCWVFGSRLPAACFSHKNWISCIFRADCFQGSAHHFRWIASALKSWCCRLLSDFKRTDWESWAIRNITTAVPAEIRRHCITYTRPPGGYEIISKSAKRA